MAAERRASSVSADSSATPGPADYADKPSCLTENPGRSIASSRSQVTIPGTVEHAMKRSGSLPPPGSYNPRVLPSGKNIGWDDARARGGLIPKGPKYATNVEEAQKRAVPGPGAYEAPKSTVDLDHGVRIAQP